MKTVMSSYPITLGSHGPNVGNWQRFLNGQATVGNLVLDQALVVDEDFGTKSAGATKTWQRMTGKLADTGVVDSLSVSLALSLGFVPFVQAKNCTLLWPKKRARTDLIVIHTMEAPKKPATASNVALWFAGVNAPQASANYCVGAESLTANDVIQCVRDTDVAWHAPGANNNGIGVEHVGYASQTPADWTDSFSKQLLENSAQLTARLAREWSIPVVKLNAGDLRKGARGFCGHVDVTNAFSAGQGHQDPGVNFPYETYLARVKELL